MENKGLAGTQGFEPRGPALYYVQVTENKTSAKAPERCKVGHPYTTRTRIQSVDSVPAPTPAHGSARLDSDAQAGAVIIGRAARTTPLRWWGATFLFEKTRFPARIALSTYCELLILFYK